MTWSAAEDNTTAIILQANSTKQRCGQAKNSQALYWA